MATAIGHADVSLHQVLAPPPGDLHPDSSGRPVFGHLCSDWDDEWEGSVPGAEMCGSGVVSSILINTHQSGGKLVAGFKCQTSCIHLPKKNLVVLWMMIPTDKHAYVTICHYTCQGR